MNWGKKILIVYLVFVVGIIFLVYLSSIQKTDLVTPDYYKKELVFQNTIDERKRVNELSGKISYSQVDTLLIIILPNEMINTFVQADIRLYCPSDKEKDIHFVTSASNGKLTIPITKKTKGYFEIHVHWTANNLAYYDEGKLFFK